MDLIAFLNNWPNIFAFKYSHWAFRILKVQLKLTLSLNYRYDEAQSYEYVNPIIYRMKCGEKVL